MQRMSSNTSARVKVKGILDKQVFVLSMGAIPDNVGVSRHAGFVPSGGAIQLETGYCRDNRWTSFDFHQNMGSVGPMCPEPPSITLVYVEQMWRGGRIRIHDSYVFRLRFWIL